jgi:hypothetical protein
MRNDDRKPETLREALDELAATVDELCLSIGESLVPVYRFILGTPLRLLLFVLGSVLLVAMWCIHG